MPVEIERRFRVASSEWANTPNIKQTSISQGYLGISDTSVVRVRVAELRGFLTVKMPTGQAASAFEYEYEIPLQDAREMLRLCPAKVEKVRHTFDAGDGLHWEVDIFAGANDGLWLAEIELPYKDTEIVLPAWLGDEITGDRSYSNAQLALNPKINHHIQFPIKFVSV